MTKLELNLSQVQTHKPYLGITPIAVPALQEQCPTLASKTQAVAFFKGVF